MTTMFVRHTVTDYKTWRKAYDDFAPVQKAKGVQPRLSTEQSKIPMTSQ